VVVRGWADVVNPNGVTAGQCNTAGGLAFKWTVRKAGESAIVNLVGVAGVVGRCRLSLSNPR